MLALIRRKIQKKFKRNRQKPNMVVQEEPPEIPELPEVLQTSETSSSINEASNQNCEIMKSELCKLAWYWPSLSRLEAQKILSSSQNGSFLIRDSSETDSFTLSFRTNSKTFHCRNQW